MLEIELRKKLIQYVIGKVPLREFQQWFVSETWDIHLSGEQGAISLTYKVELRLAEYSSGLLPENQLRHELSDLLSNATFTFRRASSVIQTSDNSAQLTWQPATPLGMGQPKYFGTLSVEVLSLEVVHP